MLNTSVRAAAEGMPNVSRRRLLVGAAAISTAAAVATVAPHAHASAGSTDLQEAIAACRSAEATYSACNAREEAIAEVLGDKLFPKWTPPGGLTSIWSHRSKPFNSSAELEAEIARRLEQVEQSWASSLMDRAGYNRWMANLASARDEGLTSLREQEAAISASGYHEAYRQSDEAHRDLSTAFDVVLRQPCVTLEDVRGKAVCLLSGYQRLGLPIEGDDLVACFASFCTDGEA